MSQGADRAAPAPGPYQRAAAAYRAAGWRGVLPLPAGVKWPPPTGYTGVGASDPDDAQIQAWCSSNPAGNVALRMPNGVIGIDVDQYGSKIGAMTLATLEAQLGPLPATWVSSSRDDGVSGIRFYRVPPGVAFRDPGRDVETIQRGHRYAVAPPSIHPDGPERVYTWRNTWGDIAVGHSGLPMLPYVEELPWLPEAWFRYLVKGEERTEVSTRATALEVAEIEAGLPKGPMCTIMAEALGRHLAALSGGAGTRHDAMRNGQLQLLGLGAGGHRGAADALGVFWEAFSTALEGERDRGAAGEWQRAMRGAVATHALSAAVQPAPCIHDEPRPPQGGLQQQPPGPWDPSWGGWASPGGSWADQQPRWPGQRRTDLGPYLSGAIVRPDPAIGGQYAPDGTLRATLYPRKWHTLQGATEAGKSLLALWHCIEEMRQGNPVVYAHFEEDDPSDTIARLRAFGVSDPEIMRLFWWIDCTRRYMPGEFAMELHAVSMAAQAGPARLVVLDGMNAACSRHGWDIMSPDGVGQYRDCFVTPGTQYGAAVLSLGHPPKARDRQDERHGFGSTAWLDEVTGSAFRVEPSRTPIRQGADGYSRLYVVKDRPGTVGRHGVQDVGREPGWRLLGIFKVDDTPNELQRASGAATTARIAPPLFQGDAEDPGAEEERDGVNELAQAVLEHLRAGSGAFQTVRQLRDELRAAEVKFKAADLEVALLRLVRRGELLWPETEPRKARPGWLTGSHEDGPEREIS